MNYIQRLQAENKELKTKLECVEIEVTVFQKHLIGDKFQGTDTEKHVCPRCQWDSYTERRKDWIATADVHEWLRRIKDFCR